MQSQFLFFFSTLGAFNGFVLSLYFAIQARNKSCSNYFLSALLFVLSIRIIKSVFFYFNPDLSNIFIQIGLSACTLIGSFLFLYLKSSTEDEKPNWIIHIVPYLILLTLLGVMYPYVEHRAVWQWIVTAIYTQWFVYIAVSFKYVLPIIQKIIAKESLKKMDIWLLSIYGGVFVIWLAYNTASYTSYIVGALSFSFVLYLVILLLVLKNNNSDNNEPAFYQEKEKYKNKPIAEEIQSQIEQKILLITEKELFLNPNFTLEEAAKELKVTKHILSQYLNEKLGKSFSTLINEYKIEKAKKLLETEKHLTIESIGYDSGFNSKSTFFTTFKKITGQTPTEYQKMLSK